MWLTYLRLVPCVVTGKGEIFSHLLLFARKLKEKGLKITSGRAIDAFQSLRFIDLSVREDFSSVLKANFVSCKEDLPIYDDLFELFWGSGEQIFQTDMILSLGERKVEALPMRNPF